MFFNDSCGSAIDKRFVFQFVVDRSQFGFDFRDLLVEPPALGIPIAGGYFNPNFSHLTYSNYCSHGHFELNGFNRFSAKKSSKCRNFFFNA